LRAEVVEDLVAIHPGQLEDGQWTDGKSFRETHGFSDVE
jgi:hypothetical protein